MQAVYDANKLSKLVEKKKKMHNWLDYYQLKYVRDSSRRPTLKVWYKNGYGFLIFSKMCVSCVQLNKRKSNHTIIHFRWLISWRFFSYLSMEQTGWLGLWGNTLDAIDFYTSNIEKLENEVSGTVSFPHCNFKFLIGCSSPTFDASQWHIWYLYSAAYCSTSIYCHLSGDSHNALFSTSHMGLLECLLSFLFLPYCFMTYFS